MTELETGAAHEALLSVRSESERLVDLRLVPWNVTGATRNGPERFRRGAFRGQKPEHVALEAIGAHGAEPGVHLAGRGVALEDREDGLYGTFRVSKTRAGDELLELAHDGVYRNASIVFEQLAGGSRQGRDGVTEHERARLWRVGIVEKGAYPGAEVLGVRSGEIDMSTRNTTPDPEPDPEPTPDPVPIVRVTRNDPELMGRIDEVRDDLLGRMARLEARGAGSSSSHPLASFGSFVAFMDAAYDHGDDAPLLARALVDQITTDNPGVIPPAWLSEVAGIIARPRPAITALGGARSLGDSGMEIDWPYLDPALSLDTIVAKQTAQKTEIASVLVKILKGSSAISTYAGGSDVSYQLIRRSKPAWREAYLRILAIAYARTTEKEFETALLAAAGSSAVLTASSTADQVRAFLFGASATVEDNTGMPATVDLVSPAEFVRLGGLAGLWPPAYGTSNIAGTAQASTLRVEVSGLPIIRAPFLTGNTHLVTNAEAAGWHEDGPFPISAEDVARLGQNVAIWGMGAVVVQVPKGIVKSTLT